MSTKTRYSQKITTTILLLNFFFFSYFHIHVQLQLEEEERILVKLGRLGRMKTLADFQFFTANFKILVRVFVNSQLLSFFMVMGRGTGR